MTEVLLSPTSAVQKWRKQAIYEYVRQSRFLPYTGPGSSSASSAASGKPMPIIQILNELTGVGGNVINVPLITRLKGQGVSGSQVLVGNEDTLGNYNAQVATDWIRNGIVVPKSTSYKTDIDLWNAGKMTLGTWMAEKLRDNLIQTMASVIVPGQTFTDPTTGLTSVGPDQSVYWSNATAAQQNAYLVNNIDRIVMGHLVSNTSSGVMATALANIAAATDRGSVAIFNLAKRLAKKAGTPVGSTVPHIRPYMTPDSGREYYVAFCASNTFRDIELDASMVAANTTSRAREGNGMDKNPIFQDGDLIYNGVIYVCMPELDQLTLVGAGNGGSNVDQNFMVGQQALVLAYSQMLRYITNKERDYEFRPGVAVEECRGTKKLSYNGTMLGVVPVFTSSVPDA